MYSNFYILISYAPSLFVHAFVCPSSIESKSTMIPNWLQIERREAFQGHLNAYEVSLLCREAEDSLYPYLYEPEGGGNHTIDDDINQNTAQYLQVIRTYILFYVIIIIVIIIIVIILIYFFSILFFLKTFISFFSFSLHLFFSSFFLLFSSSILFISFILFNSSHFILFYYILLYFFV